MLKCSLGFPQKQKKQNVHRRRCAVRKKKNVILRKKTEANDVEVVERERNHVYFCLHEQQIHFESLKNAKRCKLAIYIYKTHFPKDSIRLGEKCNILLKQSPDESEIKTLLAEPSALPVSFLPPSFFERRCENKVLF